MGDSEPVKMGDGRYELKHIRSRLSFGERHGHEAGVRFHDAEGVGGGDDERVEPDQVRMRISLKKAHASGTQKTKTGEGDSRVRRTPLSPTCSNTHLNSVQSARKRAALVGWSDRWTSLTLRIRSGSSRGTTFQTEPCTPNFVSVPYCALGVAITYPVPEADLRRNQAETASASGVCALQPRRRN